MKDIYTHPNFTANYGDTDMMKFLVLALFVAGGKDFLVSENITLLGSSVLTPFTYFLYLLSL